MLCFPLGHKQVPESICASATLMTATVAFHGGTCADEYRGAERLSPEAGIGQQDVECGAVCF